MPARAPAKADVRVDSELRIRVLCWTEGGCSGEKVGGMRSAAGLMFGCAAGSMAVDRCFCSGRVVAEPLALGCRNVEYIRDLVMCALISASLRELLCAGIGGCADAEPSDISLK
mgnify:CR=1 FL=1